MKIPCRKCAPKANSRPLFFILVNNPKQYVLVCHPYVTRMYSCHPYVTRMYSYVTRMYSYVICMSFVCTRMSSVCHCMYSYVIRMSLFVVLPWTLYSPLYAMYGKMGETCREYMNSPSHKKLRIFYRKWKRGLGCYFFWSGCKQSNIPVVNHTKSWYA